uniref:cDNA FLJ11413 fis, clone HEMBA1000908 n=1 Tax=Homo sapiens TaxID=9606 RepID=Q9HAL2_HUMAN|nr:unnamed protein product [Homo sapiens]
MTNTASISFLINQTRPGSRCSGSPSASPSTMPTSCTKCQTPTTWRGTAGRSLERDSSESCWAWRMPLRPTDAGGAGLGQGRGKRRRRACRSNLPIRDPDTAWCVACCLGGMHRASGGTGWTWSEDGCCPHLHSKKSMSSLEKQCRRCDEHLHPRSQGQILS